jgi:1,4-alpha-glucan branching enzyme
MHKGYLCLVLHAHLPYVRHPEYEYFLEENWLFEAITETYIPLLDVFSRLINDGVDFRITVSLSPPLIEMLNDILLRDRYLRHIGRLIDLSERELFRTRGDIHFEPVARMYHERFIKSRYFFEYGCGKDLVSVFRSMQDTGKLEIITSAATHAFLPNLSLSPQAVTAQLRVGAEQYARHFGKKSNGIWLPECGFAEGFDRQVRAMDMRYFFLETHGLTHGKPFPPHGVYAPAICPSGVYVFGRDSETAAQVWSSVAGYPGDFFYRDFYRDIGFDLDLDYVNSYLEPYGAKTFTGLKYHRITGKTDEKKPYLIRKAKEKASEHAAHFMRQREMQVSALSEKLNVRPVINAMYDAELFGHWWFEGPEWLECLFRGIDHSQRQFRTITPSEYLDVNHYGNGYQACEPCMSSWGDKGYNDVWLNETGDYVYRHLLKATEYMTYLADRFPEAQGILLRALNQAAREILLMQHSDWTFMIKNGISAEYAKKRLLSHIERFHLLYQAIISGEISEERLSEIEDRDRIFRDIDYRVYESKQEKLDSR